MTWYHDQRGAQRGTLQAALGLTPTPSLQQQSEDALAEASTAWCHRRRSVAYRMPRGKAQGSLLSANPRDLARIPIQPHETAGKTLSSAAGLCR